VKWHDGWPDSYRKLPEVRMEMDGSYLSDTEMARRPGDDMTWRWREGSGGETFSGEEAEKKPSDIT
jgi:hypothetical protein